MTFEERMILGLLQKPGRFAEMFTEDIERAKRGEKPWHLKTKREKLCAFLLESVIPNVLSDLAMVAIWVLGIFLILSAWITLRPDRYWAVMEWVKSMPK